MTSRTPQESFWQGDFGDQYVGRNQGDARVASDTAFFASALARTKGVSSVLELGPNIGLNLSAIRRLLPDSVLSGVEINETAAATLAERLPEVEVHVASILDFEPATEWDLVFTKGVLIHVGPTELPKVYDLMYRASRRYVLVAEYYSPTPTEVQYRGHDGKLFKRDFAGDILELFPDLSLVDYGFAYRGDENFPQDDITWFLMEKG